MTLQEIVVIVCRPSESGNVGAICRAMKNMRLGRLRIVSPEAPLDDAVVRARAVHASDLWEKAQWFDDLPSAIADCAITIGITRRRGKNRKTHSLTPHALTIQLKDRAGPAALVFGNERTGLSKEEISLCDLASHIPANEVFPSLNLSHAVQIFAYELSLYLDGAAPSPQTAITRERVNSAVLGIINSLESLGFYKQAGRDEQTRFFRELIARAGLSMDELKYLESIFQKIGRLGSAKQTKSS